MHWLIPDQVLQRGSGSHHQRRLCRLPQSIADLSYWHQRVELRRSCDAVAARCGKCLLCAIVEQ